MTPSRPELLLGSTVAFILDQVSPPSLDQPNQLILKTSKANSVAGTFAQLFTSSKSRGLCDISGSLDDFEVKGYVSKEGHHNKNLQYVYVNGRLVLKSKVHRVVNWMISRSSISRKRHEVIGDNGSPSRLTSERFGIYVINVTCPLSQYDITFDPRKTLVEFKSWGSLLRCLEKAVGDFLVREGLKGERSIDESPDFQKLMDEGDGKEDTQEETLEDGTEVIEDKDEADNDKNGAYGANISTWQSVHNKHSIAVCRPRQFTSIRDLVKDSVNDEARAAQMECDDKDPSHSEINEVLSLSDDLGNDSQIIIPDSLPAIRDKTFISLEEESHKLRSGSMNISSSHPGFFILAS